jgi:hypothetical protein
MSDHTEDHPIDRFCRRLRLAEDLLDKVDDARVTKHGRALLLIQIAHLHERALEEAKALVASGDDRFADFVPGLEKIEAHKPEWLRQAVEMWRGASQPRH